MNGDPQAYTLRPLSKDTQVRVRSLIRLARHTKLKIIGDVVAKLRYLMCLI